MSNTNTCDLPNALSVPCENDDCAGFAQVAIEYDTTRHLYCDSCGSWAIGGPLAGAKISNLRRAQNPWREMLVPVRR